MFKLLKEPFDGGAYPVNTPLDKSGTTKNLSWQY